MAGKAQAATPPAPASTAASAKAPAAAPVTPPKPAGAAVTVPKPAGAPGAAAPAAPAAADAKAKPAAAAPPAKPADAKAKAPAAPEAAAPAGAADAKAKSPATVGDRKELIAGIYKIVVDPGSKRVNQKGLDKLGNHLLEQEAFWDKFSDKDYQEMCKKFGWEPKEGLDEDDFGEFLTEKESKGRSSDKDLMRILDSLKKDSHGAASGATAADATGQASSKGDGKTEEKTKDEKGKKPRKSLVPKNGGKSQNSESRPQGMGKKSLLHGSDAAALAKQLQEAGGPESVLSRPEMIMRLFKELDKAGSKTGRCGEMELLQYAQLSGFDGSDAEWRDEYLAICKSYNWNPKKGANECQFAYFVNDEDVGSATGNDELQEYLVKVAGKAGLEPEKQDRTFLVNALFKQCDGEGSQKLKEKSFRNFASLLGYPPDNSDADWGEEYDELCKLNKWDKVKGVSLEEYTLYIQDPAGDNYCSDRDIQQMLADAKCSGMGLAKEDTMEDIKRAAAATKIQGAFRARVSKQEASQTDDLLRKKQAEAKKREAEKLKSIGESEKRLRNAAATMQAAGRGQKFRGSIKKDPQLKALREDRVHHQNEEKRLRKAAASKIQAITRGRKSVALSQHEAQRILVLREGEATRRARAKNDYEKTEEKMIEQATIKIQNMFRAKIARNRTGRLKEAERMEKSLATKNVQSNPFALFKAIKAYASHPTHQVERVACVITKLPEFQGLNNLDVRGCTALHMAAELGIGDVCASMLQSTRFRGQAWQDSRGWTALHLAARAGKAGICVTLLGHLGLAKATGRHGETALHCAALHGHVTVCRVFLDDPRFKEHIHAVDKWERTALHCAAEHGWAEVCELMLTHHRFTKRTAKTVCGVTAFELATGASIDVFTQAAVYVDAQVTECPRSHTLTAFTAFTDGGECDNCGRDIAKTEKVMECRTCEWEICGDCVRGAGRVEKPSKEEEEAREDLLEDIEEALENKRKPKLGGLVMPSAQIPGVDDWASDFKAQKQKAPGSEQAGEVGEEKPKPAEGEKKRWAERPGADAKAAGATGATQGSRPPGRPNSPGPAAKAGDAKAAAATAKPGVSSASAKPAASAAAAKPGAAAAKPGAPAAAVRPGAAPQAAKSAPATKPAAPVKPGVPPASAAKPAAAKSAAPATTAKPSAAAKPTAPAASTKPAVPKK